jgi:hypothetical protein
MDTWVWIAIAAAVVVAVMIIVAIAASARRRARLKDRFGPEYDRTIEVAESRRGAERELRERQARHDELDLHPLTPTARDRYQSQWEGLQSGFVDRPQVAVADADDLITQVMRDVGYPVDDFESKAGLVSVDHASVVSNYRAGHDIYVKTVEGTATTEDLRQAVIAYRALFEELTRDGADSEQRS